jgi:hypothetical protein
MPEGSLHKFSLYSLVLLMLACILLGIAMLSISLSLTDTENSDAQAYSISSLSIMGAWFFVALLMGVLFLGCTKPALAPGPVPLSTLTDSNKPGAEKIILPLILVLAIVGSTLFLYFSQVTVESRSSSTENKSGITYLKISYILLSVWGLLALLLGINYFYCSST